MYIYTYVNGCDGQINTADTLYTCTEFMNICTNMCIHTCLLGHARKHYRYNIPAHLLNI